MKCGTVLIHGIKEARFEAPYVCFASSDDVHVSDRRAGILQPSLPFGFYLIQLRYSVTSHLKAYSISLPLIKVLKTLMSCLFTVARECLENIVYFCQQQMSLP